MVAANLQSEYDKHTQEVYIVDKPEWISTAQAAEMLGVSRTTIHNMIERGDIEAEKVPFGKSGGYIFRIDKSSLEDVQIRPRGKRPQHNPNITKD